MIMIRLAGLAACACMCIGGQALAQDAAQINADSLVLERTLCYGTCPAYRLSLTRSGVIHFHSRNPGDTTVASAQGAAGLLDELVQRAVRAGLLAFPQRIAEDRRFCAIIGTDAPTATVSVFGHEKAYVVEHYLACGARDDQQINAQLRQLREFEMSIDTLLNSGRWVRPAVRRR